MKVKCYSIRLESLYRITDKAFKACAYDGSEAIIPASQYFGEDWEVEKGNAYWISAWILEKKSLQYSSKKVGFFDKITGKRLPHITVEKHIPKDVKNKIIEPDKDLLR